MKRIVIALALLAACAPEPKPEPAAPAPAPRACDGTFQASGLATWVVVKNGSSLVTGHQAIRGNVAADGGRVRVYLGFAPRPSTGVELRDERLEAHVFKADPLAFSGTASSELPKPGETLEVKVPGALGIAGRAVPLEVKARVSYEGPHELEATGELELDLRQELGIGGRVDELLALVNATVADKASVRFQVWLKEPCDD